MAKELPYFKFEPASWKFGRIQKQSDKVVVVFINLCSEYWHSLGELTLKTAILNHGKEYIDILIQTELIVENGEYFNIKFLDEQFQEVKDFSNKQSKKGIKSAESKKVKKLNQPATNLQPISTTVEPLLNQCSTTGQPTIRREEKRREEIRKDDIILICEKLLFESEWMNVSAKNQKMSLDDFKHAITLYPDHCVQFSIPNQSLSDTKRHINSWLIKLPDKPKAPKKNNLPLTRNGL